MTDRKEQTPAGATELSEEELDETKGGGVIFLPIGDRKPGEGKKAGLTNTNKLLGTATSNPDGN